MSTSQTLSRGLSALEFVTTAAHPPSIEDIADRLDVHRSIAYRIVRTLEAHDFTTRTVDGAVVPTNRLAMLGGLGANRAADAGTVLQHLADTTGCTAFLVIRVDDEAVTVSSREPEVADVTVSYRPGAKHPIGSGAPGVALLAGATPQPGEPTRVARARKIGWASSSGEVIPGMASVAVPVPHTGAAVAIVYLAANKREKNTLGPLLVDAAKQLSGLLQEDNNHE